MIDLCRGAALVGMMVFHANWDASYFGLTAFGSNLPAGWRLFGHVVAASFLLLSGYSLVLADRRGVALGHTLRRLAAVLATALGLTAATWIFVPDSVILFGILHCVAVGDLLLLWLRRSPAWLLVLLAAALFVAPWMPVPALLLRPGWAWLGFATEVPDTLDYRPLLPWAGFILTGMILAKQVPDAWLKLPGSTFRPVRWLAWSGRHSLTIYLLHQAVLFPAVGLLAWMVPAGPAGWASGFLNECSATCLRVGNGADDCAKMCDCVRTGLERDAKPNWLLPKKPLSVDAEHLGQLADQCFSQAGP